MAAASCVTCLWETAENRTVDASQTNVAWAKETGASEASIRRHKSHGPVDNTQVPDKVLPSSKDEKSKGEVSLTETADHIIPLSEWLDKLRLDGHDPADFNTSHGHSIYGQQPKGGELVTLYANRFTATKKNAKEIAAEVDYDLDPVGILAELRATRTGDLVSVDWNGQESAFVVSINDIQLGQSYNGGSEATIANFHRYIALAVERIVDLRRLGRALDTLVLVIGGDLVEGCVIYANQTFSIDLNRKQQLKGVIALLLHALDTLAPLFRRVKVLACKGNHGEHRIGGKKTDLSDNDDTHCVDMAKLALDRDPNMQHIEWTIAEEEAAVWTEVYGWILVTTHGDIYAKGVSGATTERKAHAWLKNMAASFKRFGNIGRADVLITHHFHHDEMADWGDTLWRQTTSQDRGSPEFSQATGTYSEPGMLTGVMMPGHRWRDEEVLV